jgi:hypothetical protein
MRGTKRVEFCAIEIAAHDMQIGFVGSAQEIHLRRLAAHRPLKRFGIAEIKKQSEFIACDVVKVMACRIRHGEILNSAKEPEHALVIFIYRIADRAISDHE